MFLRIKLLFSPDDNPGIIPINNDLPKGDSKEDIINFLKDDESDEKEVIDLDTKKPKDKKDAKPEETDEDDNEDEEEKDELDEIEEELKESDEEIDDEKLELITPVSKRAILTKYPNVFKDFPYLEKAYYREQQYTEIFPNPKDAESALSSVRTLEAYERDLMAGNTEKQLLAVKSEDPDAFNKLVDNYLPTLAKVDERAYLHVVKSIINETIYAMIIESRKSKNESLESAAQLVNQFVMGTSDFEPVKPLSKPDNKDDKSSNEKKQLEDERKQFRQERFNVVSSELYTRVDNAFKNTIEQNIDPKDSMSPYIKRNAIRDANEQLNELLKQDKRLKMIVDQLWIKAADNNFDKVSVDKIRSAFLAKGRTLLPSVIQKARQEALRGVSRKTSKPTDNEDDDNDIKDVKSKDKSEPPRSKSNSGTIPKGMTTLEFLSQE